MATSINLRINDELEKKLREKVKEIKEVTPVGAEVNNSTVVRGALVDFFDKIDRENAGERTVNFNLKKFTNEELEEIYSLLEKTINSLNEVNCKNEKAYFFMCTAMNGLSTEVLSEIIERRR